jgi:hypothetical protein
MSDLETMTMQAVHTAKNIMITNIIIIEHYGYIGTISYLYK